MPFYSRKSRQRNMKAALRRRGRGRAYRKVFRKALNTSQVFSETVKANSPGTTPTGEIQVSNPNQFQAGKFQFQMNYLDYTTLSAYSAL